VRRAVLLLLVVLLAACNGGTVDTHALKQDSDAIDSIACEGALLANEVANEASTTAFTRVHAGELANIASNFEDALSKRPTVPGIEDEVRDLARHAGGISDLLLKLEADPTNTQLAAGLQGELEQQGGCA
jgi:hypothetical protein